MVRAVQPKSKPASILDSSLRKLAQADLHPGRGMFLPDTVSELAERTVNESLAVARALGLNNSGLSSDSDRAARVLSLAHTIHAYVHERDKPLDEGSRIAPGLDAIAQSSADLVEKLTAYGKYLRHVGWSREQADTLLASLAVLINRCTSVEIERRPPGPRNPTHLWLLVAELSRLWTHVTGLPLRRNNERADGPTGKREYVFEGNRFVLHLVKLIDPSVRSTQVSTALMRFELG